MGIVKRVLELENDLDEQAVIWDILRDREYRCVVSKWKNAFENNLKSGKIKKNDDCLDEIKKRLSNELFLFNCPNYKYLQNNQGVDNQ